MPWLRNSRATGIGFALLGLIVLVLSLRLEGPRHMTHGPGVFPSVIGTLMMLGGLAVALVRSADGSVQPASDERVDEKQSGAGGTGRPRLGAFAAFALAPLVFALLLPVLGFLIATPILIAVLVVVSGGRWPTAVVTGIVSTILLQTVFQQVMRVPLPWGVLEPYAGVLTWM